jgi:hypothetical protein
MQWWPYVLWLQTVARIFKEHYNVYHTEKPKGPAAEFHFSPDARDFIQMVGFQPAMKENLWSEVIDMLHRQQIWSPATAQVKDTLGWNDDKLMTYQGAALSQKRADVGMAAFPTMWTAGCG